MRQKLGETRTSIQQRHALICPDSHERTTLPNWPGSEVIFVITPQTGARFTEFFADLPAGAVGYEPLAGVQRFFFVLSGKVALSVDGKSHELGVESYAFLPADRPHQIRAIEASRIVVLEKRYIPLAGEKDPETVVGRVADVPRTPMKGDDMLMLQKLLPAGNAFDCEVNIMDFAPGGSLPYVETHFMEHGLLLLNGGGIYRLDNSWYSVEGGDVIWMGPFAAQWFGAIGRTNARYLIYKNWNRDPHVS
ncbi:(S)-ureidoglycine aminohydrolase [Mesorhizobium sp. SP-1A]|uniref:(S)-ureidoglycine aminohydrolase n=1 Tax=Mesorhizobium sp. SP-1A TaxID=3077840 RepID=UPI0028F6CBF7|nr:(S)-ureidoglycine aminohydrolase [Mesorhizobium sp. SP-1A]